MQVEAVMVGSVPIFISMLECIRVGAYLLLMHRRYTKAGPRECESALSAKVTIVGAAVVSTNRAAGSLHPITMD